MQTDELKTVGEHLRTPAGQERVFPGSDVLTDNEKKAVIANELERLRNHYAYRMRDKGLKDPAIAQKLSEINWNELIDEKSLIEAANSRKYWRVQEDQERERRKAQEYERRAELIRACDANYFYNLIRRFFIEVSGQFIYDSSNELFVKAVCFFFSRDIRFQELGFSFGKGLFIQGTAGLGKTKTIMAIKDNPITPVSIYSLIDITEYVREKGFCELNTSKTILLDDVGSETETVKYYGNDVSWFKEFIESYYLHNNSFERLIITTNCGGEELESKYGYRVRSRIREMFNVIQLTGNDKRK
jgi:DNA replication protein DnaC